MRFVQKKEEFITKFDAKHNLFCMEKCSPEENTESGMYPCEPTKTNSKETLKYQYTTLMCAQCKSPIKEDGKEKPCRQGTDQSTLCLANCIVVKTKTI